MHEICRIYLFICVEVFIYLITERYKLCLMYTLQDVWIKLVSNTPYVLVKTSEPVIKLIMIGSR